MSAAERIESGAAGLEVEGCEITLAAGESEQFADLIADVERGGADEPLLQHIVDVAERLAIAWRLLRKETIHGQATSAAWERAWRVIDQLQGLTGLARDTLATLADPSVSSLPAESAAETGGPPAVVPSPTDHSPDSAVNHAGVDPDMPTLVAHLLGPFQVLIDDVPIEVWPNGKSKAVLKHLLLNRKVAVAKEILMDLFWPDADPECARNSLNVSIHRLRRALAQGIADFAFVVFRDGRYSLNPKLAIWTDVDAFAGHLERAREFDRVGDTRKALEEYASCAALYNSELLPEDRYDGWVVPLRHQLRDGYLAALAWLSGYHFAEQSYSACMADCTKILAVDACDENAHRALMRCYARLCQPQLAQRQYQLCVQALSRDLGIPPSAETTGLYRRIVRRDPV